MWKTHAFRRALGPLLKQLDAEYDIPAEQVLLLANFLEVACNDFYNLALSPRSNKTVQKLHMMTAPPLNFFHRLLWSSSAKARHP
jgi:hypothetical protein